MNWQRRQELKAIVDRLNEVPGSDGIDLENIKSDLENLQEEEQDYYDNMPESFQNGSKGEKAQAAIDALNDAINGVESLDNDFASLGEEDRSGQIEEIIASIEAASE